MDEDDDYETFFRLSDALDYLRNNLQKKLYLFSWEVGICGQRKFLVTSVTKFWQFYSKLDKRHYYEVITEDKLCKLHLDLEYRRLGNENKSGYEMTNFLLKKIDEILLREHGVLNTKEDVIILESSNDDKFSIHLVYLKVVMESNIACGLFIKRILNSFNREDKEVCKIWNKKSEDANACFIDSNIYTRNRSFRLYKSTKLGKATPFLLSSLDVSSKAMVSAQLSEFSIFKPSMVTHIPDDFHLIKCEELENGGGTADGVVRQVSNNNLPIFQFPSPFGEIDQFLLSKIKPGRLLSWKYGSQHDSYTYNTKDYRYCENIKRAHSSNNVYFVLFTKTGVIRQGCYKCSPFLSEPIDIKYLLPWLYDFWENFE